MKKLNLGYIIILMVILNGRVQVMLFPFFPFQIIRLYHFPN